MKVIHFNTQEERLAYLNGNLEEIVPKKFKPKSEKTASKSRKKEKKDEVQAEQG